MRALLKEGGGGEYLRVGLKIGRKEYYPIPISMFRVPNGAPPGRTSSVKLKCGAPVCEYQWTGLKGSRVSNLVSSDKYPNHPTKTIALKSGTFSMQMKGDNIGVMMEGFLQAPKTGYYTFSTKSDDSSQVWVATAANTQDKLILAVFLNGLSLIHI